MFDEHLWASPRRTPPFFPDAVTIDQTASVDRVLGSVDARAGCSIKDSFADLDFSRAGFQVLFEAEWIVKNVLAAAPNGLHRIDWRTISEDRELEEWEVAWRGDEAQPRLLLPPLLSTPSVVLVGGYRDQRIVSGFVLTRSAACVGISNLFMTAGDVAEAWQACLAAAARISGGRPAVGYESGDALRGACAVGFRSAGRLRVWIKH